MATEFSIRAAHEGDFDFIKDTWLYSLYKFHHYYKTFYPEYLYEVDQLKQINKYLTYGAKVRVAHKADDSNSLIGFVCYTEEDGIIIVHYLFVKTKYRSKGIGKALLRYININPDKEDISVTEITDDLKKITRRKKYKIVLVTSLYEKLVSLKTGDFLKTI